MWVSQEEIIIAYGCWIVTIVDSCFKLTAMLESYYCYPYSTDRITKS